MPGLTEKINAYYTDKLKQFGTNAKGVDWKDETSQHIRFEQLSKIINKENFSVLDYGCGYGALYSFLKNNSFNFKYTGYDIAGDMIAAAKNIYSTNNNCFFTVTETELPVSDFVIASGIFNVRLDVMDADWEEYIITTVKKINRLAAKGFAFNMLPSYSDEHLKKSNLYYANPVWIKKALADITTGEIEILENYSLFEFTVLIKK